MSKSILDIRFCFSLLAMLALSTSFAQAIEENITSRLVTYNSEGEVRPFLGNSEAKTTGLILYAQEEFDSIKVAAFSDFDVWVNGKLFVVNQQSYFDSKQSLLGDNDSTFIIFSSHGSLSSLDVRMTIKDYKQVSVTYPVLNRTASEASLFVSISMAVILLTLGYLRIKTPSIFARLFTVKLYRMDRDDLGGGVYVQVLIENLVLSILAGFIYVAITERSEQFDSVISGLLGDWAITTGFVFVMLTLKFYFVGLVARLNQFKQLPYLQHLDFVKFFTLSSLVLIILIWVKFWLDFYSGLELSSWLRYYYVVVYLIFLVYFFVVMSSSSGVKKLHIITYLCSTEFLGAFFIALVFTK